MASPQRQPHPAGTALTDLFDRLSGELGELAALAHDVQDLPGRLGNLDEAAITAAQRLDVLTQRLDALTAFTRALAGLVPAGLTIDAGPAVALLNLADQRRRLAGLGVPPAAAPPDDDCEMF